MINEIRVHPRHDHSPPTGHVESRRTFPLICPHCQQPIQLAQGLCGNRQIDAILLQAERIGAELHCGACGLRFVFHRVGTEPGANQFLTSRASVEETPRKQRDRGPERPHLHAPEHWISR